MNHPPLARHEALQPLSRDHYAGLVQARRLRHAAGKGATERLAALVDFVEQWHALMSEHFVDEERLLADLIDDAAMRQQMMEEHEQIRAMAATAQHLVERREAPDAQWLQQLSVRLHDHIRWEERVLFTAIERCVGESRLAQLQNVTLQLDNHRPRWERVGRIRTSPTK